MATLWSLPSVHQWWLPSEASMPPIVRSIRSFVADRATSPPNDSPSSDLKEMKGIFRAMKLSDDAIPTATPILGRPTNGASSPSASSPATSAVISHMEPSHNMPPHHDMAIVTLPAATAPPHRSTNVAILTKSPIVWQGGTDSWGDAIRLTLNHNHNLDLDLDLDLDFPTETGFLDHAPA